MPYKEENGWRASVMVNGIRSQKRLPTKSAARRWEEEERSRLKSSATDATVTDTLTLCNRYIDYITPRISRITWYEKDALNKRILKAWGNVPLPSITPEMVSDYLMGQAEKRSANASNKDRKNLLAMWTWGRKFLGVTHNPMTVIDPLPHSRSPQHAPSEEDIARLLMVADRVETVFLQCYLQTGARRSEIFRLTWDDLNFEARSIILRTRKTKGGNVREDVLPMNDELYTQLHWWYRSPERQFKDSPYVFVDHHPGPNLGKPFVVRRAFLVRLCERAGIKPFGFHSLRRFVASYLADVQKQSMPSIQRLLRHQNVNTTERYVKRIRDFDGTVDLLTGIGKSGVKSGVKDPSKTRKNGE